MVTLIKTKICFQNQLLLIADQSYALEHSAILFDLHEAFICH